jgi:hypothetical protein
MASKSRKFLRVILVFFLSGVMLLGGSLAALIKGDYPEKTLLYTLLKIFFELGIAIIIASIVALIFEMWLSDERIKALGRHLGRHQEIDAFGLKRIYADRQELFDELFTNSIQSISHQLKIMGICVSLFKEAERGKRIRTHINAERIINHLAELLKRGGTIQVLFLKRYPTPEELSRYGIKQGDFFLMRERDEDYDPNFWHGKRLKKIANRSFGNWIQVLLKVAENIQGYKPQKRKALLNRLQIREYLALPSLSVYIADEDIYIAPYLYKRHCSDVPAFQVAGRNSPLYRAYDEHFAVTWNNREFTTPAIPEEFIKLLAENPQEILLIFKKKHKDVLNKLRLEVDPENPEFFRDYEKTIDEIIAIYEKKHQEIIGRSQAKGNSDNESHLLKQETIRAILEEEGIPLKQAGYSA